MKKNSVNIILTYNCQKIINKSVLAAKSLELLEYPVVMVIKGGWKKWKETYPELIEIGKDSAAEVKFQVAVQDWAF
mgnify:CR=1 FL=1